MSLDSKYAKLCVELGHLMCNKSKIETRIAEILKEAAFLDAAKGALKENAENVTKAAKDGAEHGS